MTKTITTSTLSLQAENVISKYLDAKKVLLQFGCNATLAKAIESTSINSVVAVESNKSISDQFYESVTDKEKLHLMYANIGEVDAAGRPLDDSKFQSFHQYMVLPWALADKYNVMPDLIVIHGPFKVACFLYSLVCAEEGTTILFNDFFANEAYAVAREYALLEERHGDMAEFTVQKKFVMSELTAMIAKYSVEAA